LNIISKISFVKHTQKSSGKNSGAPGF